MRTFTPGNSGLRKEKLLHIFLGRKWFTHIVVVYLQEFTHSISAILPVLVLFYVIFFSAAPPVSSDQDFFINSVDRSLSNEEAVLCKGEVTLAERTEALKSFKVPIS